MLPRIASSSKTSAGNRLPGPDDRSVKSRRHWKAPLTRASSTKKRPTLDPPWGRGLNAQQQAMFADQALRTASTMGPLELAVAGSKRQPYSLAKEFANAFVQPDGHSTQQAFLQQVAKLQDTFERTIRSGVVTGQTTQDIIRELKGDGQAIAGSLKAPIEQLRTDRPYWRSERCKRDSGCPAPKQHRRRIRPVFGNAGSANLPAMQVIGRDDLSQGRCASPPSAFPLPFNAGSSYSWPGTWQPFHDDAG